MLLFFFKANSYAVGFAVRSKRTFQYVRMSFHPENVGNWSFSTQNESEVSLRSIYPELFPAPLGAKLQEKAPPSELFRSNWVKHDQNSDRIEKKAFGPPGSNTTILIQSPIGSIFFFFPNTMGGCIKSRI